MGRKISKTNPVTTVGKAKIITTRKLKDNPKRRFRILVQEKLSEKCDKEKMRSFMIYVYKGMSTIDSIKKKLQKSMK